MKTAQLHAAMKLTSLLGESDYDPYAVVLQLCDWLLGKKQLFIFIESTLRLSTMHDVFVYKAGAFTYFFCT